jgi:hypothetical protein
MHTHIPIASGASFFGNTERQRRNASQVCKTQRMGKPLAHSVNPCNDRASMDFGRVDELAGAAVFLASQVL